MTGRTVLISFVFSIRSPTQICQNLDFLEHQAENSIMTATLELKLPDSVQLSEFEIKMTLAAKLYEDGTLSGGQAAEMVGISKREFLENLGKYGVSIFGYTAEELREDLERLRK